MARIAVVDDDKGICETLARHLATAGHECIVQSNGGEAFRALKEARPEIVLVDLMMSEVSGFRLCRMIRQDPALYLVPVIVSAPADDEEEVAYCKKLGADASIQKPIVIDDLMRKVHEQLASIEEMKKRDPTTGLPGLEAIKRELNHKLARDEKIAACYLGVVNLRELVQAHPTKRGVVNELAKETATLIYRVADKLQIYEMLTGYVGAAHFVVVLKPREYEPFCKRFLKSFDSDLAFRWRRGAVAASRGTDAPKGYTSAAPKVSIGVVHTLDQPYTSADTLLTMLAYMQREAQNTNGSSYLVCKYPIPA
jgi:DNA-binding response OmpR family regulator